MKQKIVIKVQINCEKCRTKAMRIVASAEGVASVAVEGENKDQFTLVGDGVDPACLATTLRKRVGHADIIKVEEVKKDAEKESKPKEEEKVQPVLQWYPSYPSCPRVVSYDIDGYASYSYNPNTCSIM